jgi:ABC-type phosphate/phosphonate transport system substrate-binding protein
MYDWPEVQWAHDALWSAIAERLNARGIAAPEELDRTRPVEEVWRDPGLVFSQTCGWPFATRLRGTVQIVATPIYDVEGCEGPYYSSVIIARRGERCDRLADFRGRRFAYNAGDSLSGYVAFAAAMRGVRLDPAGEAWVETGSHRESIRAVAEDRADIAAIDVVCWALGETFDAQAVGRLKVVGRTPLRPALPFITAGGRSGREVAEIRLALGDVLKDPGGSSACSVVSLSGVVTPGEVDYGSLSELGRPGTISVQGLFGVLGKPPRRLTLEDIDEVIEQAVVDEQT